MAITRVKLEDELVQPCWICDKVWTRKDTDKYYYFADILACREHTGAKIWYEGAIQMLECKMKLILDEAITKGLSSQETRDSTLTKFERALT